MKNNIFIFAIFLIFLITACSSTSKLEDYSSLNYSSVMDDSVLTLLKYGTSINEFSKKMIRNSIREEKILYKEKFLMEIIDWMHVKYQYGGTTRRGVDCTGFTQAVYRKSIGINLSRSAFSQYQEGIKISKIEDLQFGDLVFFDTGQRTNPGHAGIYVDNGKFAHASSSKGVMISKLASGYWRPRFVGARRIEEANNKLNK